MNDVPYIKLNDSQINKVGNALIYLSENILLLSKTKALKLLYILDEFSISQSGIPFFNLKYKAWKFGPVSEEIFIDLSDEPFILRDFVKTETNSNKTIIKAIKAFNDDEFSDNDIELMDKVIEKFGEDSSDNLVRYTHRQNSPWFTTAQENLVLELLLNQTINNTELIIDMSSLIAFDERKTAIYNDYLELNS